MVLGKADGTVTQAGEPDRGPTQKDVRREAAQRREALAPLRKKIRDCERVLDSLRREIADLDRQLAEPELYAENDRAAAIAKTRSERVHAFARAESDWLDLSERLETEEAGENVA
jgi:ATP-binding cassette subfamily F protein 3